MTHPHQPDVFLRSPGRNIPRRLVALLLAAMASLPAGFADDRNFGDLSLEELMNETVTSVSKREQKRSDAAAAVTVLSNDDIRRSGATNLPDALRLVPGMDVASVNSSQTSVSVRGFNTLYANKLLVLVDGRAVYSPLFAGVYWDLQQPMLEDVDRIEVIRGPGATIWGANAVNGVINVVGRDARDTQGGLLYGGGGDVQQTLGGARYGGRIGEHTYYRVYASEQSRDDYRLADGRSAQDDWASRQGGFRLDHHPTANTHATWQSEITSADLADRSSDAYNAHTLGRWTRDWSDRSSLEVQAYYDRTHRDEPAAVRSTVDTVDLSLQHRIGVRERHDLIWGLGYRFIDGEVSRTNPLILIEDGRFRQELFSGFIQDEIELLPDRLTFTAGTKFEHNDYTGVEIQPGVSLVFKPAEKQTLWASVSRAVRTPSVLEGAPVFSPLYGEPVAGPGGGVYLPTLVGNPDVGSERLWAYELGWRIQPRPRVSVDLALFYNDYEDVITTGLEPRFIPGTPTGTAELLWFNGLSGHTYGGETSVTVSPSDNWRLVASYSLLISRIEDTQSAPATIENGSSPEHQVSLRSAYDFNRRLSLDGQLRYVDSILGVPSYLTADLRLSYRPNDQLEFALVGQNLLDHHHPEQADVPFATVAEVPRGFYGKITWRF